ncbi:MAG: CPBP family intramembrane metalloprotease [Kiritimatiellae bacterium]|nr:CPBP family intramembrane metalloprotease [Kiritimatiellia bacterium]
MRRIVRIVAIAVAGAAASCLASSLAAWLTDAAYALLGLTPPRPPWLEAITDPAATPDVLARRVARLSLVAVILSPAIEECVFRGLLQGWLERRAGRVAAVTLASIAFAACHFSIYVFPALVAVGVCLSVARIAGGGLAAPIIAHMLYNAAAIAAALCDARA